LLFESQRIDRVHVRGFEHRFHLDDFSKIGEPNLTCGLHVLRLLDENTFGILQQSAIEKQKRTIFLKPMNNNDIPAFMRVARLAPLQLFGQLTLENDPSQLPYFVFSLLCLLKIKINLWIHSNDIFLFLIEILISQSKNVMLKLITLLRLWKLIYLHLTIND
jgi:hypothetical protein